MTRVGSILIAEELVKIKKRELWYKRWRNLALMLLVILFSSWVGSRKKPQAMDLAHIAMLNINEAIHQESRFWDQFDRLDKTHAKAALILMNSPGGTPGDSERLYNEIIQLKSKMPVTILIENQATSGAYLASVASDRIYAYNSAMVGSIGIVFSHMITKELFEKIGIKHEKLTVGAYKGYPNSYEETPPRVVENIQAVLESDQRWFVDLVKKNRNLDQASIDSVKEAQVYSAADGLALGLIDGLSSRQEQIEILRDEVGDLPIKNLEIDENESMLKQLLNPKRVLGILKLSVLNILS